MSELNAKIMKSQNGKLFLYSPEFDTVKQKLENKWFQEDRIIRFVSVNEYHPEFIKDLAIICSIAIMSDEVHKEEETFIAQEICKELGIKWEDFLAILQDELAFSDQFHNKVIREYLLSREFGSHTKNAMLLFEASLHIVLADGILTHRESMLLADVAEVLRIPFDKIISRIAQFLSLEKEILVDVN
jgi:hypothetical protein